jgi:hypothetical protein
VRGEVSYNLARKGGSWTVERRRRWTPDYFLNSSLVSTPASASGPLTLKRRAPDERSVSERRVEGGEGMAGGVIANPPGGAEASRYGA